MLPAAQKFPLPTLPFVRDISSPGVGTAIQFIGTPFVDQNKSFVVSIQTERDTAITLSCKLAVTGNSITISASGILNGSPTSEVQRALSYTSQQKLKLLVRAKENVFEVFMNDVHVLDFVHRVNPLDYKTVHIEGPLILEEVLITPGDVPLAMTDPRPPPPSYSDAQVLRKTSELNQVMQQMNINDSFPPPPPNAYRTGVANPTIMTGPYPATGGSTAPYPGGTKSYPAPAISTNAPPTGAGYPQSSGAPQYPAETFVSPNGSASVNSGATFGGSDDKYQQNSRNIGFVDLNRPSPPQVGESATLQQKKSFIERSMVERNQTQSATAPYPEFTQPISENNQGYPGQYRPNNVPIRNQGTNITNYPQPMPAPLPQVYPYARDTANSSYNHNILYPREMSVPIPSGTVDSSMVNSAVYLRQEQGRADNYFGHPQSSRPCIPPTMYNQYSGPTSTAYVPSAPPPPPSSTYMGSVPMQHQQHFYQRPPQVYDPCSRSHTVQYPLTPIVNHHGGCYSTMRRRCSSSSDSC